MLKKYKSSVLLALISIVLFLAVDARNASSIVKGGYHDLSMWGGAKMQYDTTEICVFCHTPHNANRTQTYTSDPAAEGGGGSLNGQFLWNRRIPLAASFTPYTSPTLNADTSGGPGLTSLLCLSCHDGIGAMNVLLNYPRDTGTAGVLAPVGLFTKNQFGDFGLTDPENGSRNIGGGVCDGSDGTGCQTNTGGDLQNDHPIGFDYNAAQAADPSGLKVLSGALLGRMTLTGGRLECNTCHDPHLTNPDNGIKNSFLVMDNTGSAMCLACHNK